MRPRKLALCPGLRWSGHLTVSERVRGGYVVDWSAEIVAMPKGSMRYVMDRCVMTAVQIEEWTGVDVTNDAQGAESEET